MTRLLKLFIVTACLAAMLSGCTTSQVADTRYQGQRSVIVSADVYDVLMTALGELYKAGKLSEQNKEKAIHFANIYRGAALRIAEGAQGAEYDALISSMSQALVNLKGLIKGGQQ